MATKSLKPLSGSPNAVSTETSIEALRMEPLLYGRDRVHSIETIKMVMGQLPRTELVEETRDMLHYVVSTKVMRFKDDVEFRFDDETRQIEFRSASRLGHYDFGVNRNRMQDVSERYRRLIR
ncbi:DUF1499 domain-containing protein [Exiguobacterium sp. AM39-5BH]|uniref:DUF1499 domain-containing protein n=1 Tax=Exiguobacterium sp. AM39-5BH TaxID=2292355 RepID=UPI000FE1965B|nr:DUF1499 domain-containing protein [Exiguobacterium sp. AM39-5BH]RHB50121.1 DUF1499 domain-containing protein [Exiguobacterium sp. AM39-5BH]